MNKKQIAITLGIMCLILSIAISIQIKTMNSVSSTASRTLADNELRDNVLKWKEKHDNLSQELKKAEKKLEEVRQQATQNDTSSSAKEEELKKNNTLLGLTNVSGSGIVIEIEDGKDNSLFPIDNPSDLLIHNDDLMSLLNELRNADAEAIEINGQRIIDSSSITCEGNIIKINGEKIGSPFTIKAIGSQALLYGSIMREGSYLELMKDRGVSIQKVSQEDTIYINKYGGTISSKYMQVGKQK